jgi:hypothetical protein
MTDLGMEFGLNFNIFASAAFLQHFRLGRGENWQLDSRREVGVSHGDADPKIYLFSIAGCV